MSDLLKKMFMHNINDFLRVKLDSSNDNSPTCMDEHKQAYDEVARVLYGTEI